MGFFDLFLHVFNCIHPNYTSHLYKQELFVPTRMLKTGLYPRSPISSNTPGYFEPVPCIRIVSDNCSNLFTRLHFRTAAAGFYLCFPFIIKVSLLSYIPCRNVSNAFRCIPGILPHAAAVCLILQSAKPPEPLVLQQAVSDHPLRLSPHPVSSLW